MATWFGLCAFALGIVLTTDALVEDSVTGVSDWFQFGVGLAGIAIGAREIAEAIRR